MANPEYVAIFKQEAEVIDWALKYVLFLVASGGGVFAIVWQFFKHLSVKWLDARFDERVQSLRHQYEKELEELRFKIAAMLDRATKLYQREFEVLPEVWAKINDSYWYVCGITSFLQFSVDLDKMGKDQQDYFINNCRLLEWQKDELRKSDKKNDKYLEYMFWANLNEAKEKSRDSYMCLIKLGIFIGDEIREKFIKLNDLIDSALTEHEMNRQYGFVKFDDKKKMINEGGQLMRELERDVHRRLWPESDAP